MTKQKTRVKDGNSLISLWVSISGGAGARTGDGDATRRAGPRLCSPYSLSTHCTPGTAPGAAHLLRTRVGPALGDTGSVKANTKNDHRENKGS